MQIPILNGIYSDTKADFRSSYPRNLVPVPKKQGISQGYLRPTDGIVELGTGPGVDRGGINWNGTLYRAMGSKLVSVSSDGSILILADIGGLDSLVTFDYSFDRLAISSNGNLFYWKDNTLTQVIDSDLGRVIDFIWIDGYFMTTDGTSLVVTELNDPLSVNPLKYGSAEADPDSIKGLIKIRNEAYAVGRYTIEVFDNVGGSLFPFQRISGAQVMRGAVGTYALCSLTLTTYSGVAFIGSARNEPPAVWFAVNGVTTPLSTREIDTILQEYTEAQLSLAVLESRIDKNHALLYVHLPDRTLVYDANGTAETGEPVWFVLTSSIVGNGQYRARNMVWCYDKWVSGDPTTTKLGYFVNGTSHHYGEINGWEFGTIIVYNEAEGVIFHELELIALTGAIDISKNPTIWTSYSTDGETWSQERPRTAGRQGKRDVRLNWLQQGNMKNWRIQKFRGTSDAHISIARLEARIEALRN
ncbi:Bacteriophage P22, Gp10, DNA-stabilising [uncultured Caudovirales phage]|uniref:Bacteriophage P22, Gp10, DNA-stabilising n=1 Tax=uncultured Caudovirales phage TaxID=2100421 RepID=A0A6J5KM46_9CAUD|nr:Bacteriophage P22, Gp10, DNA-stabilising [uncultured Caudovirales phage]